MSGLCMIYSIVEAFEFTMHGQRYPHEHIFEFWQYFNSGSTASIGTNKFQQEIVFDIQISFTGICLLTCIYVEDIRYQRYMYQWSLVHIFC